MKQVIMENAQVRLRFGGPLVIVGGGAVDPDSLRSIAPHATGFVGADRGGDLLMAAGIVPDAVIGDMDSVADRSAFPARTEIFDIAEQDTTDFEKCLYSTEAPVTVALGMTGGRFDHTLAALHAVARHAATRRIILLDEHDLAMGVDGDTSLDVGAGARVSIYPLGRTVFGPSVGLRYPLDGLVLEQGHAIGTSNRAIEDRITITIAQGPQSPWLLILERSHLLTLLHPRSEG
jgi:thiamine pyrophosphokinase